MENRIFSIILLLTNIIVVNIFSQKTEPINSGFVFVNGEYISPPYTIEQKEPGLIYVNDILVMSRLRSTDTISNPYRIDELPEIPESINRNTSLADFEMIKYNDKLPLLRAICFYYYTHFPKHEAEMKVHKAIVQIPCIKSYQGDTITFYNGDIRIAITDPYWCPDFYEEYGIHLKKKLPTKKEIIRREERYIDECVFLLNQGFLLHFIKHSSGYACKEYSEYMILRNFINDIKNDSAFYHINCPPEVYQRIEEIKLKHIKEGRFRTDTIPKSKSPKSESNNSDYFNKSKSNNFYSPSSNYFNSIGACTWDYTAFGDYIYERDDLYGYIYGSDYYFGLSLKDDSPNDDNPMNLSYSEVTNIANDVGVFLVATHGRPPNDPIHAINNGLFLWYATSENAIKTWCGFDSKVIATEIIFPPSSWSTNLDLWGAFVQTDWVDYYWKNNLELNNTISVISSCYSFTNGFVAHCAGGVAFGYDNLSYEINCITNELQLFKRMNGVFDNAANRDAWSAYNNMPQHLDDFMCASNKEITLCPATIPGYTKGEVFDDSGTGFFEVDTYCDASINPADALKYNVLSSGLDPISNIHWVGVNDFPVGGSNRIEYTWNSTENFHVKFIIDVDNFRSYGESDNGYHRLDFNRKTPIDNSPLPSYDLWRGNVYSDVNFYADNTYILEGNSVEFTNSSSITSPLSYLWDFGDGCTSTDENPTHIYNLSGIYDVTLSITNNNDVYTQYKPAYISVFDENTGELACYNTPNGNLVNFDAYYYGYNDPAYTYEFIISYGDNDSEVLSSNSPFANFTHTYATYGLYQTNIIVKIFSSYQEEVFSAGCSCGIVDIYNPTPCSGFEAEIIINPNPAEPGTTINFSPDISGGTSPFSYLWAFDADPLTNTPPDGGISNSILQSPSKIYSQEGHYPVFLSVMDANGCVSQLTKNVDIDIFETCFPFLNIYSGLGSTDFVKIKYKENNENCGIHTTFSYGTDANCSCSFPTKAIWVLFDPTSASFIATKQVVDDFGMIENHFDFFNFPHAGLYYLIVEILDPNGTSGQYVCDNSKTIEIEVIDCDLMGFFNPAYYPFCVLPYLNTIINPPHYSSGSFILNDQSNQFLDTHLANFSACNEIVMQDGFETGNMPFIAEVVSIEDCYYQYWKKSQDIILNPNQSNNYECFTIYPNPARGNAYIDYAVEDEWDIDISIYNATGMKIGNIAKGIHKKGYYSTEIDISTIAPGFFYIRYVQNNSVIKAQKLIIQ